MANIPQKVQLRLINSIKKFNSILLNAKSKDINESDTVVIVTDILSEIFGYDKYSEITSEYSIKKTYCDLAIKIDSKVRFLIEVKAIGLDLKSDHIKQVVDYGANLGTEWVILTNGLVWKVFKIIFGKPIENELVYELDLTNINTKKATDLDLLYYVSKESLGKSALEEYHIQKQNLNKYFLGQLILTDSVIDSIRKTLRKISPDAKIENEEIRDVLVLDIFKREVLDGEKADDAKKKVQKNLKSIAKKEDNIKKQKTQLLSEGNSNTVPVE